jgi:hypothetical protein
MQGEPNPRAPRKAFQAPSFPTLCKTCNTDRLGSLYDPYLIAFANNLSVWIRGAAQYGLVLPSHATVRVRGASVARAVVGHLLAAEDRANPSAPLSPGTLLADMRAYFLRTDQRVPKFRIYVWPYAGPDIVIVRGFGLARVLGRPHDPVVGDVLKFAPFAFWVVGVAPPDVEFPFAEIPLLEDDEIDLRIGLERLPSASWPEQPLENEVVALATERSHIGRRSRSRPAT